MTHRFRCAACTETYDLVRRYLNRRIGSGGRPGPLDLDAAPPHRPPPSARNLSFQLVKPRQESRAANMLKRIRERDADLNAGLALFEQLLSMLRRKCRVTLQTGR
jgi:hypothetical protein